MKSIHHKKAKNKIINKNIILSAIYRGVEQKPLKTNVIVF